MLWGSLYKSGNLYCCRVQRFGRMAGSAVKVRQLLRAPLILIWAGAAAVGVSALCWSACRLYKLQFEAWKCGSVSRRRQGLNDCFRLSWKDSSQSNVWKTGGVSSSADTDMQAGDWLTVSPEKSVLFSIEANMNHFCVKLISFSAGGSPAGLWFSQKS